MEGEGRRNMELQPYRREEAAAYARHWAYGRNPEFYDYERIGGDCTNFASQCIYAGTGVMNYTPTFGWYYIDADNKAPAAQFSDPFRNFPRTDMHSNAGSGSSRTGRCDPVDL